MRLKSIVKLSNILATFQTWERLRFISKVLSSMIDICAAKYFQTVVHMQVAYFSKKNRFFLIWHFFFVSTNNQILTKVIPFSQSMSKRKVLLPQTHWFDFADVSSYLRFKISARTRGCTISLELQLPKILLTPSGKLYKDLPNKEQLQLSNGLDNFYGPLNQFYF